MQFNKPLDDQWKAVGSPPRRPSLTGTLGYTSTNSGSMMSQNLRGGSVPVIKEDSAGWIHITTIILKYEKFN